VYNPPKDCSMQEIVTEQKIISNSTIMNLSLEDKQKLVGVFAWLIEEDRKQNPTFYQIKKINND
jgi:hypothetical protein